MIAGEAAANCARFLMRTRAAEREGRSAADVVADVLARKDRVMGFGRPAVGPDERVPIDYGMTPDRVHAVSNYWVAVAVYAQAVFSGERGLVDD